MLQVQSPDLQGIQGSKYFLGDCLNLERNFVQIELRGRALIEHHQVQFHLQLD